MKTNEYIYPYKPFADLRNIQILDAFLEPRSIRWNNVAELLSTVEVPTPKISGDQLEENILSVFLDEHYLLGSRELITDVKEHWIERFKIFTSRNEPLHFVIMACPFKVPVPLKTFRKTVDLAEILQLSRVRAILKWIQTLYAPGAYATVLAEGILGKAMGVSIQEREGYYASLETAVRLSGLEPEIKLHNLDRIIDDSPNFADVWDEETRELMERKSRNNSEVVMEYQTTMRSLYRLVMARDIPDEVLMEIFGDDINPDELSHEAKEAQELITQRAHRAFFSYRGFINARDRVRYLDQIAPNHLKLTVSPKRYNLGVLPVNKETWILPHHGVPVHYRAENLFTIMYWIDIRRAQGPFKPVHVMEDAEDLPFYYEH